MAINRYYTYNPMQAADYSFKLPLDFLGKTLESLQNKSDENYAALQQLPSMIHVNALEGYDTEARNKKEQYFKDKINNLVSNAGNDFSGITKDIYGLKSELHNELTRGDLAAISSNYNDFDAYKKKMLEQKDMPKSYADLALNKTLQEYNQSGGYGKLNPITGDYNRLKPIMGQAYDFQGKLSKVGEFKDITEEKSWRDKVGDWYVENKTKDGGVDYQRAYNSLMGEIVNDPMAREHIDFLKRIGYTPEQITQQITGLVEAEAGRRTKLIHEEDKRYQFDPMVKINQDERQHREKMALKQKELDALTSHYYGKNLTIGAQTTGDYAPTIDFSSGAYDPKTGKKLSAYELSKIHYVPGVGSIGTLPLDKNKVTQLKGQESLDLNNPVIKSNPLAKQALLSAYIKDNPSNRNIVSLSEAEQNKLLNAWSNGKNISTNQQKVKKQYEDLAKAYNQKTIQIQRIDTDAAASEAQQMIQQRDNVQIRDFQTGQTLGSLNQYAKSQGGKVQLANTKHKDANMYIDVQGDYNGERVAVINIDGKDRKVIVGNFDNDKEAHYQRLNKYSDYKPGVSHFSGTFIDNNGAYNKFALDNHNGQKILRTQTDDFSNNQLTTAGLKIIEKRSVKGVPHVLLEYPNGNRELVPYETETNLREELKKTDRSLQKRTAKSTNFVGSEYWRNRRAATQDDLLD